MTLRSIFLLPVTYILLTSYAFSASSGTFTDEKGREVSWKCLQQSSPGEGWVDQGSGCYHKFANGNTQSEQKSTSGTFTNADGSKVSWKCNQNSSPGKGWVDQGSSCYHKLAGGDSGQAQNDNSSGNEASSSNNSVDDSAQSANSGNDNSVSDNGDTSGACSKKFLERAIFPGAKYKDLVFGNKAVTNSSQVKRKVFPASKLLPMVTVRDSASFQQAVKNGKRVHIPKCTIIETVPFATNKTFQLKVEGILYINGPEVKGVQTETAGAMQIGGYKPHEVPLSKFKVPAPFSYIYGGGAVVHKPSRDGVVLMEFARAYDSVIENVTFTATKRHNYHKHKGMIYIAVPKRAYIQNSRFFNASGPAIYVESDYITLNNNFFRHVKNGILFHNGCHEAATGNRGTNVSSHLIATSGKCDPKLIDNKKQ